MLSFTGSLRDNSDALVIFVTDKFDYKDTNKVLSIELIKKINSLLKLIKTRKKEEEIFSLDISEKKKCFVIKVKDKYENYYFEEVGGAFYTYVKKFKNINSIDIYADSLNENKDKSSKLFSEFIFGFNLKSYTFNKYKTLNKEKINRKVNYKIISSNKKNIENNYKYYHAIKEGVFLSRDLVSEPPNVLNPKTYVQEIKKLSKLGLKVKAYNEKELKKLGLNALLGVGLGSSNETYLVTLEWHGKKGSKQKPLAFVGKGVCFDTGGISLKPARFMEEMKYDMAGSAVVVGLLKSFALRKAKINAIGVVGLVENMPGSKAQRPGDIVKSYSGKTIEVLNTDAEGRLVLADALSFVEKI